MKKPKKLLIVCPYPQGVAPSQRLKYEQYFEAFRNDGWIITVSPFIGHKFWAIIYKRGNFLKKVFYSMNGYLKRLQVLFTIRRYDVVYVHLWATPFGPPVYEWLISRFAKRIVYDIDDLVYLHGTQSKAHPVVNFIKGRSKPIYLIKHAQHVITCTPFLNAFVKKYNPNTTDISSTVDTEKRYLPISRYDKPCPLTIGWSGSVTTAKYFYLLTDVLKKLKEKYHFNILTMGDCGISISGLEIEALPWQESYEMEVLQRFDIGVYPLPDEQWVYGKSGLKAIQYMALGVPTVASAIGANFRVIENGVSGFLVNSEEEWVQVLSQLLNNAALRKRIGEAARKKVEHEFSIKANQDSYLRVLNANYSC